MLRNPGKIVVAYKLTKIDAGKWMGKVARPSQEPGRLDETTGTCPSKPNDADAARNGTPSPAAHTALSNAGAAAAAMAMAAEGVLLPPATPSELIAHTLAHLRHPTTLVVCWPRRQFVEALVQDVQQQRQDQDQEQQQQQQQQQQAAAGADEGAAAAQCSNGGDGADRQLLKRQQPIPAQQLLDAPLLQVAVSRHIRVLFVPSVVHLRAHLAASLPSPPPPPSSAGHTKKVTAPPDIITTAPPHEDDSAASHRQRLPRPRPSPAPLLLVYGLLELHRDGAEWSAQGLNTSLAVLVDCAARVGLAPALMEPRRRPMQPQQQQQHHQQQHQQHQQQQQPQPHHPGDTSGDGDTSSSPELLAALAEPVPILSGSERRRDGSWSGRTVPVGRVLGRWFDVPAARAPSAV
ncbi:mediator of RNA polymerase II transcription subunit 4 [Purpureocillium lavendulum]|uniref:Mediator of RNA polymerase II transcription subunit 4 n=1 Tax=Purpureocillium lavendulum TaxID=1247861 RepID=A0AB34G920_9HYPO|nr:mediator of RNA polymerase II transcription subunit 4 [Purpureocillium lavendulum]